MRAFMATAHNPCTSLPPCATKSHPRWQEMELVGSDGLRWVVSQGGLWCKSTTGDHLSAEMSSMQGPVSQHARGIGLCMVALATATPPAHPTAPPGTWYSTANGGCTLGPRGARGWQESRQGVTLH